MFGQLGLLEVAADFLFLDAVEDRRGELEAEQPGGPAQVGFQHLADVHARRHAQRVQHDVHRRAVRQERHVLFGHDLGHDALVAVAAGHFVADGQFALGGDIDLDRLDDAAVHSLAGFGAFHFLVVLHLQVVELLFEAADDLVDLVADGRGVDLDAVVDLGQLAQERLGDLAVGRDDDFAGLAVDDVERDFFAEQDVAQGLGQLLAQFVGLLLVLLLDLLGVALGLGRRSWLRASRSFLEETLTSMTMP